MRQLFDPSNNFSALSLKDLLHSRDLFHYHLMSKANVVATAIGLYRIRKSDPWPTREDTSTFHKHTTKRTLFNSEVRPYSWPCIYVFVNNWETEKELANSSPSDVVPKTLYLPDGRSVPVCVIEAQKQRYSGGALINPLNLYPRNTLVPGTAILNEDAQGLPRLATAGCVVKDGEKYYILTNKHAIGESGTAIKAFKSYQATTIGNTSEKGITRKLFGDVYPAFTSTNQYIQMDIGLIELTDIKEWKTNPMNLQQVEDILDLYDNNITLKLIGQKVVGHGAVTGDMRGEIHGLFYRHKALGGYEYLSDFLIGPETDSHSETKLKDDRAVNIGFKVHHGDSGTLLLIEEEIEKKKNVKAKTFCYHPFALLWGKHEFVEGGNKRVQPYALATSLSTALNILELDFVRDINADNDYTWGYIGHFAIANKLSLAIALLSSPKLKSFVEKNSHLLSMEESEIKSVAASPRVIRKSDDGTYDADTEYFVPLADVPDNVWKSNVNIYMVDEDDGKKIRKTGPGARGKTDNPNHYADIDLPNGNGETLLGLSLADTNNNLKPSFWLNFYASVEAKLREWHNLYTPTADFSMKKHWGALPFRVWQIVDAMIGYAKVGKQDEFFCAGGVLIHYVGDACQPLHSSYLSQGDPENPVTRELKSGPNKGKEITEMRAAKVHAGYEDEMIDAFATEIMDGLDVEINRQENDASEMIINISSGFLAASALLNLLQATQNTINPADILDKWEQVKSLPKNERINAMWEDFGVRTIEVMARGTRYLAKIWEGAWTSGNGNTKIGVGRKLLEEDLKKLYDDKSFLPSIALNQYKLKKDGHPIF